MASRDTRAAQETHATPDFDQLLMSIFILEHQADFHFITAARADPFLYHQNQFTSAPQYLLLICFRQLCSLPINKQFATYLL